eukprot:TRINITY_DN16512_c0_g1_i1.p1 TRINITY_DN16512_c0_g1~~TRINITY_DN16512_c0_g1_i1.p1  ORF type:complete len:145 (+),score=13.80 TRINITY_DN16512_c0_g1_i1:1-435(+)
MSTSEIKVVNREASRLETRVLYKATKRAASPKKTTAASGGTLQDTIVKVRSQALKLLDDRDASFNYRVSGPDPVPTRGPAAVDVVPAPRRTDPLLPTHQPQPQPRPHARSSARPHHISPTRSHSSSLVTSKHYISPVLLELIGK